ncbi:hypothetical protein UFVDC4_00008 [Staphylococcus phage vB_SauM-UFV_DC4]|nr:hypothetical protein UFVDC4_00008 [Staphylococcus phage vB_SauM-UFV_DC4]BDE75578.1 hypothetical protein [Staphylococcus phage S6]
MNSNINFNDNGSSMDELYSRMQLRAAKQVEKDILGDNEKDSLEKEVKELRELVLEVAKKYDVKEIKEYLVRKNMK